MNEIIALLMSLIKQIAELQSSVSFGTVSGVFSDGVSITFDGQTTQSIKHYKVNSSVKFSVGNRVKVTKSFGTYVVDYVVGSPGASIPHDLPSGGTNGQVLTKDGSTPYSVKWASGQGLPPGGTSGQVLVKDITAAAGAKWDDAPHELPTGGTANQVLAKSSATNYAVKWMDIPGNIPSGGTDGQVLTKNGSTAYSVKWANAPHDLPSGGTDGQVLTKNGSTAYSVKWDTPSAQQLKNGTYTVSLNTARQLVPAGSGAVYGYDLGTSTYPWRNLYTNAGTVSLNCNSLSFFGHTAAAQQTVASTATVATLITALKNYGLIK